MIESILDTLQSYASRHDVPIADDPTRQYIKSILEVYRPRYCLEIGSAIGYSTIAMAANIQRRWGKLDSCEVSYPSYRIALHHIYQSQLSNIVLTYGDFRKFPADFYAYTFDFVFVDGQKNQYLEYYLKLVQNRLIDAESILVFDDVIQYAHKIQPLIDHLDSQRTPYTIHPLNKSDGILVIGASASL